MTFLLIKAELLGLLQIQADCSVILFLFYLKLINFYLKTTSVDKSVVSFFN